MKSTRSSPRTWPRGGEAALEPGGRGHPFLPVSKETSVSEQPARGSGWLIAPVVALAAFMEIMDISIANVSLPHIAGDLSSSQNESTWVLTSYLVTNAVVMPISGWLSNTFGRKRFFLVCIAGFTHASLLCGLAPNLASLIALRAAAGRGRRWSAAVGPSDSGGQLPA